jgi:TonB family protein
VLPLVFFAALRLAAQDVIINAPSWVNPNDPPDQLPVIKMDRPDYPERLEGSTEIGYVVIDLFVFDDERLLFRQRISTDDLFNYALEAASKWRVKPALRAGQPVNSIVRQTIIFNPACASAKTPDATPRLLSVVMPEVPSGLAKDNDLPAKLYVTANGEGSGQGTNPVVDAGAPNKLYVTASIDATGQVTNAVAEAGTPEAFGQLAENAVLKWQFAPARKNGQAVAQDVRVPVLFLKSYSTDVKADTPPHMTHQGRAVYPDDMRLSQKRGSVKVRFTVDIEGRACNAFVVSSTNPGFNQAAINAILEYRFEPARRDGVPVSAQLYQRINFNFHGRATNGEDEFDVSNDQSDQSKLPPELRYDIPPKPDNILPAVYPFELLRDHIGGTADVRFLVSPSGEVEQAVVVKATRPEFGQALLAMLDVWKFLPAMKDGKPTQALLDIQQEFSDFGGDVPVSGEAKYLLYELKQEKPALCPLKELDARPRLIAQPPPVFPSTLIGKVSAGQAVVEFLIDHDGNVQLPRIVSATDPAFGYAAAQGVVAWKFAPLTSHGQPADVRAKVPIDFTTPAPAPAADSTSTDVTNDNSANDAGATDSAHDSEGGGLGHRHRRP